MTLNNLLVEMRAEFEKEKLHRTDWCGNEEHECQCNVKVTEILAFIETQMKRVSEETYKAVEQIPREIPFKERYTYIRGPREWNRCIESSREAYESFTHQPCWKLVHKNKGMKQLAENNQCVAFTLSDLPHVLREIDSKRKLMCQEYRHAICDCKKQPWLQHFLIICELFVEGGMEASEAYLLTLIK